METDYYHISQNIYTLWSISHSPNHTIWTNHKDCLISIYSVQGTRNNNQKKENRKATLKARFIWLFLLNLTRCYQSAKTLVAFSGNLMASCWRISAFMRNTEMYKTKKNIALDRHNLYIGFYFAIRAVKNSSALKNLGFSRCFVCK